MEEKNYSYTNWYHIHKALSSIVRLKKLSKWIYDNKVFYKYKKKDIA